MDAHVGRLGQPRQRLAVEVGIVEEGAPVEEALADVADGPLDLALGPGSIRPAGSDAEVCPASTILANVLPQMRLLPDCLTEDVTGNGRLAADDGTEHESLSQFSSPLP